MNDNLLKDGDTSPLLKWACASEISLTSCVSTCC